MDIEALGTYIHDDDAIERGGSRFVDRATPYIPIRLSGSFSPSQLVKENILEQD
jgi:hypothetical protein